MTTSQMVQAILTGSFIGSILESLSKQEQKNWSAVRLRQLLMSPKYRKLPIDNDKYNKIYSEEIVKLSI